MAAAGDLWWLNGRRASAADPWLDITGTPLAYLPWAPGEPNDAGGNEDCLTIIADPSEPATRFELFNDQGCGTPSPALCQCK